MSRSSVPRGGPANFHGLHYQLLWTLFHATQWKVIIGPDHGITAILEPESGIDLEYRHGQERYVEQIKSRSTRKPWGFSEFLKDVLPSLYRCVEVEVTTSYVFVTETSIGDWQGAYRFFQGLRKRSLPHQSAVAAALDDSERIKVGDKYYTERSLFHHIVHSLAASSTEGEQPLKVWHLLGGLHFRENQDFPGLARKIDLALSNHGVPPGECEKKRKDLIGDLISRADKGNANLQSTDFFKSHGLSEISLKRWVEIQERARQHVQSCLDALGYRYLWDVREVSPTSSLFLEKWRPAERADSAHERPLVSYRSSVLLTGESGQGKSWQLYRLAHDLAQEEQIAVLIQATGAIDSDLQLVADVFCREIWGSSSKQSLRDVVDLIRRELPTVREPWLTVLIDGVRDEEYALGLLRYPWQGLGLQVILGCRRSDRLAEAGSHTIPVTNFSQRELSNYLQRRLGVAWLDFPEDVRKHMFLPLFARLFCDLQRGSILWQPANEYQLFERAWNHQAAGSHLAASAVARLAARLPEQQVYPWPLASAWEVGLRDPDIRGLLDSGLLRLTSDSRSFEVWHDRILNWAVAEGLVSALRIGEITVATLLARSILAGSDSPLHRRLNYVAMDTLWLLTTPEFGLSDAVRQALAALESPGHHDSLAQNLSTLGPRIVPHILAQLEEEPAEEEDE